MKTSEKEFYLRYRLKQWGGWCSWLLRDHLQYPSKSICKRLMDEGGILIRGTSNAVMPYNEAAEEIDDLVAELIEDDHDCHLGIALRCNYIPTTTFSQRANLAEMPPDTFRRYVREGKRWLDGRLSHTKEYKEGVSVLKKCIQLVS